MKINNVKIKTGQLFIIKNLSTQTLESGIVQKDIDGNFVVVVINSPDNPQFHYLREIDPEDYKNEEWLRYFKLCSIYGRSNITALGLQDKTGSRELLWKAEDFEDKREWCDNDCEKCRKGRMTKDEYERNV